MSIGSKCLLKFCLSIALIAPAAARAADEVKPIKALLVTGGCCHDYEAQKKILSEGISARAHVEWTIVLQGGTATNSKIPLYEDPDWAKGYDVVVHNECFADIPDPAWTERVLKPHREGLPAVVIHCAMHCYRDKTDEWFKFLGVTSRGHGGNYPFEVINLDKESPIMKGFGDKWQTPAGELYLIEKMWPDAKPLAHAMSTDTKKFETCIWTNLYGGKTRVFGTTLGHHNSEMSDPVFLNFVTRGLLWSVDKLDDKHLKPFKPEDKTSSVVPGKQPTPALVPIDLSLNKPATASSTQDDARSPAKAVDGDPQTRWSPGGPSAPQWLQVDLGKPEEIAGCRILWEFDDRPYQYKVEGSADGQAWQTLVDQTAGSLRTQQQEHKFQAKDTRYVRLTVTGLAPGSWASLFEFEVLGKQLVKPSRTSSLLPRAVAQPGLLSGIKVPPGFEITLFAAPPEINYPTCLSAAPTGELYVGVDLNGSLDAKPDRGSVVRCIDEDGDGRADKFNVFARMDSPRGVHFDAGTLYVLHPPQLTAYYDENADGVADREEVLVDGIGFDLKYRGADHTTNGLRLGIDGWLYVAVGDYGFVKATGKDGQTLQLHGGGVVRVRTDGTGLEIVSRGQRNIYDVAIDPLLNAFTRDNTNDGGGWDVRLSHVVRGGQYGYPSLFVNFGDEIIQPLADYGGGSPCGSLFVDEAALPEPFGRALYTCEWGRSAVFRHPLTANGASFTAGQETFIEIPRPTDMDIDGEGRIFISSWRDGGFNFSGPNVGYVVELRPTGSAAEKMPDLRKCSDAELLEQIAAPSHVQRLSAQRELLRRGDKPAFAAGLERLCASDADLNVRVAAMFTLKQLRGSAAAPTLVRFAAIPELREFALRALTDNKSRLDGVPLKLFVDSLSDLDPRVRLQAVTGLARLGQTSAASAIAPLLADADLLVAHLAVRALVDLSASSACFAALDSGNAALVPGCVRVLSSLHEPTVVDGLIERLARAKTSEAKAPLLKALCRLYYREADWKGDWWGTRPDTSGPIYNRAKWDKTDQIGAVLLGSLDTADRSLALVLLREMALNKIESATSKPQALKLAAEDPALAGAVARLLEGASQVPDEAIAVLAKVASSEAEAIPTRASALRTLSRISDRPAGLAAAVRAFGSIGKHPNNDLLQVREQFARDGRRAAQVADFAKWITSGDAAERETASTVLVFLASNNAAPQAARDAAARAIETGWQNSETTAALLRAIGWAHAEAFVFQVRDHQKDPVDEVRREAEFAASQLQLDKDTGSAGPKIAQLKFEDVLAQALKSPGDAGRGAQLFARQGCIACHTVSQNEALKGPLLAGIAARYSRPELIESILKPSAKIAQGFETQFFVLDSGKVVDGFVVRESGEQIEVRGANAQTNLIAKSEIDERGRRELSIMPTGLADPLTPADLASLLAYLESLKAK
jgi:putative membrane-bound dehydrogenase-like protein